MQLAYTAASLRESRSETNRKSARVVHIEREIRPASVESHRQLVDLSPDAIFVYRKNKLTLLNRAASRMLGADNAGELLGRDLFDFVHPDHRTLFHERAPLPTWKSASTPFVEQVWQRLDGTSFHAEIAVSDLIHDGAPSVQIVVRDISERKRNEELQLGQNRILNMLVTGAELRDILLEIGRLVETQSRGLCSIHMFDDSLTTLAPDRMEVLHSEPVMLADKAGTTLWTSRRSHALARGLKAFASRPIFSKQRKQIGALALYFRNPGLPTRQDLELLNICTRLAAIAIDSRASAERLRYLAHYDGLTSLPNRFLFNEYLDLALHDAQRNGSRFAVLFVDFDRFKEINDTFGHEAGDHVLRETAARLRGALRQTDKIARMGGDEFYVLIPHLENERDAADVAQKLLDAASRPLTINGQHFRQSISIGVAIYPGDGDTASTLLKNADSAMYGAKGLGRNGFRFHSRCEVMQLEI